MKTIILVVILLFIAEKICLAKKEMDIVRIADCPQYKNHTVIFKNIALTRDKKGKIVLVRFQVQFKKELKRMMIMLTVRKCENSENLDSCEYYIKDFKINNACDIIGQKNQIWSEALSNSNFPRSCPIPAGVYKLNDTKLYDMQLTLMTIPVALWKTRFLMYDSGNDNILVGCMDVDVKIYTARRNS